MCSRIDYHFLFTTDDGQVTPPVVLAFDTLSHDKPSLSKFAEIQKAVAQTVKPPNLPEGIDTDALMKV